MPPLKLSLKRFRTRAIILSERTTEGGENGASFDEGSLQEEELRGAMTPPAENSVPLVHNGRHSLPSLLNLDQLLWLWRTFIARNTDQGRNEFCAESCLRSGAESTEFIATEEILRPADVAVSVFRIFNFPPRAVPFPVPVGSMSLTVRPAIRFVLCC